jgi:hypothetical protein
MAHFVVGSVGKGWCIPAITSVQRIEVELARTERAELAEARSRSASPASATRRCTMAKTIYAIRRETTTCS